MTTKLLPRLKNSKEHAASLLTGATSPSDIAEALEIPRGQLLYILYERPVEQKYRKFDIPKKTRGYRTIRAPIGGLSILQCKLKPLLEEIYRTKGCVHGFVKGRSILTNAKKHVKKRYVLNIDLDDFFGHINFGRIRALFMSKPFGMGHKAASVLAELCVFDNQLPQGSPTSPVLANLIAADLDRKMMTIAEQHRLTYTRYSDDLSFSTGSKDFPKEVAVVHGQNPLTCKVEAGKSLEKEIRKAGFAINKNKVRLQINAIRQEVTGLTVNKFPNVKRTFIRKIRAQIHAWQKFGLDAAARQHCLKKSIKVDSKNQANYFKQVIYGELAYLKMIRSETDSIYLNLCSKLSSLDLNAPKFIEKAKNMKSINNCDVFICHASEDKKEVAIPLHSACEKIGLNVFIDEYNINWGDSITKVINQALGQSKFVVAVISSNSLGKKWPEKELYSAIAREIKGKQKVLTLKVGNVDIAELFPLLADKLYLEWEGDADMIANEIEKLVREA